MSGQRKDPLAFCLRGITRLAAIPYAWAVRFRNRQFDRGSREICRADAPVVSIGNITAGGTGKTPMVAWIARHFREQAIRVSIVSRGYGAGDAGVNDEAMELEQRLPDVPHVQNPDRVEAAQVACDELATQLILLDDGFQHRRLARDLEIVLIDATCPFGYGHVLPRGLLREPISGLRRADVIVLTRADHVDSAEAKRIEERCQREAPDALWVQCTHAPASLMQHDCDNLPLSQLVGKRVLGICAIGNPQAFRATIERCGAEVAQLKTFVDHHRFTREDIDQVRDFLRQHPEIEAVVCTQKDLVKLRIDQLAERPLWAISIEIKIDSGEEALKTKLNETVNQHLRD